jgi:outer membrane protein TolC
MRKYILVFVLAISALKMQSQTAMPLSLDDAIKYAIDNQPQFRNYKLDREIADARKFESSTRYAPKVNGSVDLRDNLKLGEIALKFPNPVTGEQQDLRVKQGTTYSGTAGVDLNQPILDMGAISDMKIAREQSRLSDAQIEQALIDLKMNVSRMYYLALLNNERVVCWQKNVERYQKVFNDTKVKFENDNALKTDVSRSQLNLSNAKYQLKVSQDSVQTSIAALAQLIGASADTDIKLSGKLPVDIANDALLENTDFKNAGLNRVELRAEALQLSVNKMQLNKINFQYVPSLNGYAYIGGQGLDNDNLFRKDKWFWTSYVGLKLNVPIFDGLQKVATAKQQKLAIQKNENNLSSIRNNIRYQLQTSSINYKNAYNNLLLIKENVTLAESIVADANVRFSNAIATYQEVLDAENTLKETEFNYLQALYAYLIAELDWKKANGKL